MTTLSANIDDAQTLIPISGPLVNGEFTLPLYYTIGSESIRVTGRAHRTTWLVERGIAGTTAASHSSGATLTRYYPDAVGGGDSNVPDPSSGDDGDAVQVSAGAYILGPTVQVIYASEDPGAVGAGTIWLRIDGSRRALFVRNEADDGWITPQITVYETDEEGSPFISRLAIAQSAGNGEADLIAGNPDLTTFGSLSLSVAGTILSFTDGNDALQITLGDSFGTTGVHLVMGDGVTEAKLRVTAAGVEMEGLPTVNPGVGNKVWNDAGTLKITAAA